MKLTINSVTPFARVANLRCELLVFMYSSLYFVLNLPQRMHVMQLFVLFQLNRQKKHGTVFNKFDKYYVHIVSSWCTASEISRKKNIPNLPRNPSEVLYPKFIFSKL